jgi:hypothetical protein
MNPIITELLDHIRRIEEDIEREAKRRRAELHADFENKRVAFEHEVLEQQRRFREGILKYLGGASWRDLVCAPIIYSVFLPLVFIDLVVTIYQYLFFSLYKLPRVSRRDYFVFDRAQLAYLNWIEKLNCAYCSYANGLAGYLREICARTEQYWCPIKHARRLLQAHPHQYGFVEYGDAEAYRRELENIREKLKKLNAE